MDGSRGAKTPRVKNNPVEIVRARKRAARPQHRRRRPEMQTLVSKGIVSPSGILPAVATTQQTGCGRGRSSDLVVSAASNAVQAQQSRKRADAEIV